VAITVGHGQNGMIAITRMLGKQGVGHPHQEKKSEGNPIGPRQHLQNFHALMLPKEKGQF
jgi:hypothetical protein